MPNHTLFIADLHLDERHSQTVDTFLKFMEHQALEADALYILGDFFEVWLGDDDRSPFNEKIKSVLKQFSRQIPLYFIRGNRDAFIGRRFAKQSGCQLLNDPTKINLYNTPVLVMHGDALCTRDLRHMEFRRKVYNPFLRYPLLACPLFVRRKIATNLRKNSQQHLNEHNYDLMDVTQDEVERIMSTHQVSCLIHGHTHRPHFHHFSLNEQPAERIVLGAWYHQGHALKWHSDGRKEFINF